MCLRAHITFVSFFSSFFVSPLNLHSSRIPFPLIPQHNSRNLVEPKCLRTYRGDRRYRRYFTPPRFQLSELLTDHSEDGTRTSPRLRLQCPLPPFFKSLPELHASLRPLYTPELDPASARTISQPTAPEHKQRVVLALRHTISLWPTPFPIWPSTAIQHQPGTPTLSSPATIYAAAFGFDVYVCGWICKWCEWTACV